MIGSKFYDKAENILIFCTSLVSVKVSVLLSKRNDLRLLMTQHVKWCFLQGRPFPHQQIGADKKLSAPIVGANNELFAPTYMGYTA